MPPTGFKPTVPTTERPETHALDHVATGIGKAIYFTKENYDNSDWWQT
jgi:hypothetical protein